MLWQSGTGSQGSNIGRGEQKWSQGSREENLIRRSQCLEALDFGGGRSVEKKQNWMLAGGRKTSHLGANHKKKSVKPTDPKAPECIPGLPKSCVAGILNEGPGSLRKLTMLYQTWSCKGCGISEPFAMKAFLTVPLFEGLSRFNQNFPFLDPREELVPRRRVIVYLCLEQMKYTELIIALRERIVKTFSS